MLSSILNGGLDFVSLIAMFISYMTVILVTMPIHEWAHAFVATKLGDPTPSWHGRLSLNPLAHLDLYGVAMLLLFGFGFAKAVPVNPRYFKNPRQGMALVALAGPASNILVAILATAACRVLLLVPLGGIVMAFVRSFLLMVAQVNISLAVFNLLPIPPLDGFRIASLLLPSKWVFWFDRNQRYVTFGLLALIALGVLDKPLAYAQLGLSSIVFGLFGF